MKWCNLLSIQFLQIFDYLTIAGIINIHIRNKDHTRKFVFLTHFPRTLCSGLNARLSGNHNNRSVCYRYCLFYFSHKVKISRCIQNIYLNIAPRNRDYRCMDGKLPLVFFLVIITYRVAVCDGSHSIGQSCQICHCFCQRCLATSPVAQENYITNLISCVNIHRKTLLYNTFAFQNCYILIPHHYMDILY